MRALRIGAVRGVRLSPQRPLSAGSGGLGLLLCCLLLCCLLHCCLLLLGVLAPEAPGSGAFSFVVAIGFCEAQADAGSAQTAALYVDGAAGAFYCRPGYVQA